MVESARLGLVYLSVSGWVLRFGRPMRDRTGMEKITSNERPSESVAA